MSILGNILSGTALGVGGSALSSLVQSILVRPRSIAGFIADVTIEERHEDALAITSHPVERGSSISDHAYRQPSKLTIRCGWSNSSMHIADALSSGNILGLFDPDYVRTVYDNFLALQRSRQLFDVVTGKRTYSNMLIARLVVTTDDKSENSLMMICECQEIIMADTQAVSVPSSANMKSPSINGGTVSAGQKQLSAVN